MMRKYHVPFGEGYREKRVKPFALCLLYYLPDGTPVTSFSVATNRRWGGETPGEETTWFKVSAFRRQAETCHQYLTKGQMVMVEGVLSPDRNTGGPRVWTTQDGNVGASYDLRAFQVVFLGSRNDRALNLGAENRGAGEPNSPPQGNPIPADEMPF